jgi:hypothetical protein
MDLAGEGALGRLGGAVFERVRPQHVAPRQEGDAHGRRLEAQGHTVVGPLADFHLAGFHVAAGVGGEAAGLQTDDVGDVAFVEDLAGGEDLEIMGGGVAGEQQIFFPLPDDFVADGDGNPVGPEPADGQVIAFVDESFDGLFYGHRFASQCPVFLVEELPGLVRIGIHEKGPFTLANDLKHILSSLLIIS